MYLKHIESITQGPRQSNIELLRIIAMFMVLVVHANFVALGSVSWHDLILNPVIEGGRTFCEIICIPCVNIFILISGWFGIRTSKKGFLSFIFQCLYFYVLTYVIMILLREESFHPMYIARFFWFSDSCWFEKSYTALYILSPVLNSFIANASKKTWTIVLISFFLFEFLYGITNSTTYINYGYSAFSFIGLYLLGAYLRKYCNHSALVGFLLFILSTFLNFVLYILLSKIHLSGPVITYINPIVILQAVGILFCFNNLKLHHNRIVNKIGKSTFAVYLFHTSPAMYVFGFLSLCNYIYSISNGIFSALLIFLLLLFIYFSSIVLDMPRIYIWKKISYRINKF